MCLLQVADDPGKNVPGLYLIGFQTAIHQLGVGCIVDADVAGTEVLSFLYPFFNCSDLVVLMGVEYLSSVDLAVDDIDSKHDIRAVYIITAIDIFQLLLIEHFVIIQGTVVFQKGSVVFHVISSS